MGEKCYSQMEVIVPELFRMNCVGKKKKKTRIRAIINQHHMVKSLSEINEKTKENPKDIFFFLGFQLLSSEGFET